MYSYCTLFDKNYLDKGLVLIDSIRKYNRHSTIYVLAMDSMCYDALHALCTECVIPVRLEDFETEELLEAKKTRSRGEYCWTCGANFIYYVLTEFGEKYCTYLDADMRFYDDPDQLVEEMVQAGKSVQIVEHRFRNGFTGRVQEELSGKYCVQFNTFKNDKKGMEVLDMWRKQTIEQCEDSDSKKHFGDQMYLEHWPENYDCVHVLQNLGAGLAPWNINRYELLSSNGEETWVICDGKDEPVKVIFFHYHDLKYIAPHKVDIGIHKRYWKINMKLAEQLYRNYLRELDEKKELIKGNYDFYPMIIDDAIKKDENLSTWNKIKKLFEGNAYKNIRFRMGNYTKIFLFRKYDRMDVV